MHVQALQTKAVSQHRLAEELKGTFAKPRNDIVILILYQIVNGLLV